MPRKDEAPTVVSLFDELEESFIVIVVFFLLWRDKVSLVLSSLPLCRS